VKCSEVTCSAVRGVSGEAASVRASTLHDVVVKEVMCKFSEGKCSEVMCKFSEGKCSELT
jgi:hypothetical protein